MPTCPHGMLTNYPPPCPECSRDEQILALRCERSSAQEENSIQAYDDTGALWADRFDALRTALSDLVDALPKCDKHGNPATRAWRRGDVRYCDECGVFVPPRAPVPEYPHAAPLRRAIALLRGASPAPPEKEE
jgi:hypothetical protein